ncbi:uncharacterized protein M421DRAFT_6587 [Didymella exigua CBS 183.55]|uniref:Dynamin N-terminal domain-containing protein n=1 Tax=Didymella exigua CBS 183.55 TaxID=1150837 RepID=A0A6A5RFG4_9PLEO|nr:uncharacterized protein M421DRAFT_6587 [Didymella exigua CBS 183.55]KAF1927031.1 hypothetical protein M421DRAFT_6587 [Didymella exigua CBS 183.55]
MSKRPLTRAPKAAKLRTCLDFIDRKTRQEHPPGTSKHHDGYVYDPNLEIADLLRVLDRAKKTPQRKKFNMAIVGNQGVGKSSTINALMNRDLVDASVSSSACTAFATIIEYKDGACDDAEQSGVKVTYLELGDIHDFMQEHIRR